MFKKIASIALAAALVGSTAVIAASAAETDEAVAAAADDSAVAAADDSAVGADDGSEATGASTKIFFDATTAPWGDAASLKNVTFYLYDHADGEIITWGSKKGKMTHEGNGVFSYDLAAKGITLDSSHAYGCIFTSDWSAQTCDLALGADSLGDTAYCTDQKIENNVDSNKKSQQVLWKSGKYGNPRCITSIGNVIGTYYWPGEDAYSMFVKFLSSTGADGLQNALKFNGKDEQTTVDDVAKELGLGQDDIEKAVAEAKAAGVTVNWKKAESKADAGSKTPEGSNNNNTTNDTTTNTSTNTTGGGSDSGSGSGSGSTSVTSGEGTTLYFVIGGVMLAAIGVFFLARKKREY